MPDESLQPTAPFGTMDRSQHGSTQVLATIGRAMAVRKYFIAALLLAVSSQAAATGTYQVSADLLHNGSVFSSPSAIVKGDTPVTMEVSGPSGYKLSLTVTDVAPDQIRVVTALDSSHGAIAPVVVVRPGVPATVSVGELGLTLTVNREGS